MAASAQARCAASKGPETSSREGMCPRSDGRRDGHVPDRSLCPLGNFDPPIYQGMLGILKCEYIRPYQTINAMRDALEHSKYCRSFLGNPCLALIIKRPIETVEIKI